MRILFCNIAWMKEYRGNEDGKDIPLNGGSYVDETGDAHEKYNFTPVNMEGREGLYCLGFFETKSHNGKDVNQMRIENIAGCELLKKEESVDDVLVVYCFLQASDQERFNGKFQENQVVGLMVLDERMSGMPVKRIAGCKIILRD